ncbi:hypothetical protein LSH36_1662g00025 [Paralvinella palmiformis]|uniref:WH2 domain-containing protein n=1 Tax=Paralvinella palmiformis TaxID=53620 RepID=A0AAD9IS53_9ANNE|nr:hypothetical protein LSH36_1662g00025 [Paralvinella palmiformis]
MADIPEAPELPPIPPEILNPEPPRANLLESIRKAGGFGRCNLKSARERKLADRQPGGKDLMGDLKASLRGRGGMMGLRAGLRPSGRGLRK